MFIQDLILKEVCGGGSQHMGIETSKTAILSHGQLRETGP